MPHPNTARRGRPPSVDQQRVLDATYELLREKGVARITTKEIAERAGVAEGSIFYRYGDRAGLLTAVYANALTTMADYRRAANTGDVRTTLLEFATALEAYLERGLVVMYNAQADADLLAALRKHVAANDIGPHHGLEIVGGYLARLRDAGEVRADVDLDNAAFLLISSCMMRVSQPRLMGHELGLPTREQVIDTLITLLRPAADGPGQLNPT